MSITRAERRGAVAPTTGFDATTPGNGARAGDDSGATWTTRNGVDMGFGSTGQLMIIVIGVLAVVAALWGWQALRYFDALERTRRRRKHDHALK